MDNPTSRSLSPSDVSNAAVLGCPGAGKRFGAAGFLIEPQGDLAADIREILAQHGMDRSTCFVELGTDDDQRRSR